MKIITQPVIGLPVTAIPILAMALVLAGCGSSSGTDGDIAGDTTIAAPSSAGTIIDVIRGNEDFSQLVSAIEAASLTETLNGAGPITVFAPSNAAFTTLPEGRLDALKQEEGTAGLSALLNYHIVPGRTDAATLIQSIEANEGSYEMTTVNGAALTATQEGEAIILTDAAGQRVNITTTDVEGSNGIIHVIDAVVMPSGTGG